MTIVKPQFSVSLMCMDLMRAGEQLNIMNKRANAYHIDIMDGHFAKNIALSPDFVKAAAAHGSLPMEMHLMTEAPSEWIPVLADNGAATISVHAETVNRDAFRILRDIHDRKCDAGVVLNPATSMNEIEQYIDSVQLVTVMTVDVGYAGQPFIDQMLKKITAIANYKRDHGLDFVLQIDGSCNERTFKQLNDAGAEMYILGSSGLFNLDDDLDTAWDKMERGFTAATGVSVS